MKLLLLLLLCITFNVNYSQNITLTSDSDSSEWNRYLESIKSKFNYKPIDSKNKFTFRISTYDGMMVEINESDEKYNGSITYFVTEEDDSRNDNRSFKKIYPIAESKVIELFKLIKHCRIDTIPGQDHLQDWGHGKDGITYNFEYKKDSVHSFKTYWSPHSQEIKEGKSVQNFLDIFLTFIEAEKYKKEFRKEVPFFRYSFDEWRVSMRPLTKEEYSAYKKRKRKMKKNKSE